MSIHLTNENVWFDQYKFMDAERDYYSKLAQRLVSGDVATQVQTAPCQRAKSPLIEQITSARKQIHQSLASPVPAVMKMGAGDGTALVDLTNRMQRLELENAELKQVTNDLKNMVTRLSSRVEQLERKAAAAPVAAVAPIAVAAVPVDVVPVAAPPAKKEEAKEEDDDDDDFDMFGSDDDEEVDEEEERIKQERLAAYAAKKSKKPALIAKSSVLLDVKPWDDETDMVEVQRLVRTIEMDGLLWGQGLLKPVGYGINKLVINCVVEDDKVSIEELTELIQGFEDHVQSVDVAAFNKI